MYVLKSNLLGIKRWYIVYDDFVIPLKTVLSNTNGIWVAIYILYIYF